PSAETSRKQRRDIDRMKRFARMRITHISGDELRQRADVLRDSVDPYGVRLFAPLTEPELETLASMLDEVPFEAGDPLCREDDTAQGLYLVASGRVEVDFGGIYELAVMDSGALL